MGGESANGVTRFTLELPPEAHEALVKLQAQLGFRTLAETVEATLRYFMSREQKAIDAGCDWGEIVNYGD